MNHFNFEKLGVYQASIEVVVLINKITESFPRGRAYLTDQLQRAGTSISLNIAEGAGEFSPNEKRTNKAYQCPYLKTKIEHSTWLFNFSAP